MKKLIVGLVAVLLLFGGFVMWNQKNMAAPAAATAAAAEPAATAAAAEPEAVTAAPVETPEVKSLDYAAIRALHGEDETAVTLADETLDWGFYADFLRTNGMQYEDYFRQMAAYYGIAASWDGSVGDGTGKTYAQDLLTETNETLGSFMAIHALAKEKGVTLDEKALQALEPEQMAADICGEGATVEKLAETLEQGSHMTIDGFRYYSESIGLYGALFKELYGENGEKLSEEEVIDALEQEGFLSAGHILFMTIDPMTGKDLEEKEIADKLQQAEKLVEELRAIKEPEALVKRFAELKEQYCEDTGKTAYPDGYTFTPGTMVQEFEDTVKALGSYEVSDPVKTSYGYHIIMRLPLSGDSLLFSAQGTPMNARSTVAQEAITKTLDDYYAAHPASFMEGLEELDLTQFIK